MQISSAFVSRRYLADKIEILETEMFIRGFQLILSPKFTSETLVSCAPFIRECVLFSPSF